MTLSRRELLHVAATIGASLALGGTGCRSRTRWRERRELYPEGVASGDPDERSVILWTRRPFEHGRHELTVEVAEDEAFERVIAHASAPVSAASDWTTRVLVADLLPSHVYWYRFTDEDGNGSRVGRTITAPTPDDPRPIAFAFVSCQDVNEGKLNAYRKMIHEDERASEQLEFVLHLGDFIYEVIEYPDEEKTRYDRTIYEVARIPDGLKVGNFHIPLTLDGYRAIYKGYLHDPDLQDARARWPFVAIWDNHEFSWGGYQSILQAGPITRPGQSVKVAANQAWFEYLPARVTPPSGTLEQFGAPIVEDVLVETFDDDGLGIEPNNLVAINSLKAYRAMRWGKHLDLVVTDQHSYRSPDPFSDAALGDLGDWDDFNGMFPEDVMQALDAGRAFGGGAPAQFHFDDKHVANSQRHAPPQTILGAEQKAWLLDHLKRSTATWKIWGNSQGTLESRADPENLPTSLTKGQWPAGRFANLGGGDYSSAWVERGEIYNVIRDAKITGFAIVSGDLHSFWAGYASAQLPPATFEPVGLSFIGGSLTSPGTMEAQEHKLPKDLLLRPLYLVDRAKDQKHDWTFNMLLRHGVRSCLEYAKTLDRDHARAFSNPDVAPHLAFVDMGGHGYATIRLSGDEMRTEFVCIPRPITRSERADGGPLRYRIAHVAKLWRAGERPQLVQHVLEGDPGLGT